MLVKVPLLICITMWLMVIFFAVISYASVLLFSMIRLFLFFWYVNGIVFCVIFLCSWVMYGSLGMFCGCEHVTTLVLSLCSDCWIIGLVVMGMNICSRRLMVRASTAVVRVVLL